jgi:hypothetical protein
MMQEFDEFDTESFIWTYVNTIDEILLKDFAP